MDHYNAGNFMEALKTCTIEAEKVKDDHTAIHQYGLYLEKILRKTTIKYSTEFSTWVTKEADNGNSYAQYVLGSMLTRGYGVQQNVNSGVDWLRISETQANPYAYYGIGLCHYEGSGLEKDLNKALTYFIKSAQEGVAIAQTNIGFYHLEGIVVKCNYEEAEKWTRMAAEAGEDLAQNNLGYMYDKGYYLKADGDKAVDWYTQSALGGNTLAQNNLGTIYMFGYHNFEKNYREAIKWFKMSADQNDSGGIKNLKKLFLEIIDDEVGFSELCAKFFEYGSFKEETREQDKVSFWWKTFTASGRKKN